MDMASKNADISRRLALLQASIANACILMATISQDGRIREINAACEQSLGYATTEIEGRFLWDLLDIAVERELVKNAFSAHPSQFPKGFLDHFVCKNGSHCAIAWTAFVVEDRGQLQQVILVGRNISDTLWTDKKLKNEDIRSRLILEQLPAIVWTTDRNLVLTTSAGGGIAAFRERSGESVGTSLYELMHTSDPHDSVIREHLRALGGEKVRFEVEKFGYVFQNFMEPLRDESGNIKGVVGISIDITEQKRTEKALRESVAKEREMRVQVERLDRIKDEFLVTLSHELRTPLVPILGWIDLLRDESTTPQEINAGLAAIERNARAELTMIEDLLEMSRVVAGTLSFQHRSFDLKETIQLAIEAIKPTAEVKSIKMNVHLDNHSPHPFVGDANRLRQAFGNVISNAIKFSSQGGIVDISLKKENNTLKMIVKDNGIGIDASFLPHVFERFLQADSSSTRSYGGLGIGLTLAQQLVEAHGGSIKAESQGLRKGAVFTISLPIHTPKKEIDAEKPSWKEGFKRITKFWSK